jgi:uncharacterized membrane protein (DUF106 family)
VVLNTNVVSFQIVFWKNSHFKHQKSQKKKKKKKNGGKTKKSKNQSQDLYRYLNPLSSQKYKTMIQIFILSHVVYSQIWLHREIFLWMICHFF